MNGEVPVIIILACLSVHMRDGAMAGKEGKKDKKEAAHSSRIQLPTEIPPQLI